jgi:sec-independent protein translocase protein TatC
MTRNNTQEMTFLQHLGELRKRIFYSFIFIVVFFSVSWFFVNEIFNWFTVPVVQFLPEGKKLAYTSLTDPFMMYIKVAFISGLFLSIPFIFYQLWLFISPGLYKKEKKYVFPFVFFTTAFFIGGALFGYYSVFPIACKFFLSMGQDFEAIITIDKYYKLIFRVLLGIGVVFELPVLSFFLAKIGILRSTFLIKYFKYAIVIIFIIAAVITPTPDIVTQSMFAVPMILLYLLSILIVKLTQPKI